MRPGVERTLARTDAVAYLAGKLLDVLRLLHHGKRENIGLRCFVRLFLEILDHLEEAVDVVPEFFLLFFELRLGIGARRQRNVVGRGIRPAGTGKRGNLRAGIMPLRAGEQGAAARKHRCGAR